MAEKSTGKTRAHTIYKCADGKRVIGVTTALGILNKPALVKWANNLGLKGIDSSKFTDEKAKIGTLAHYMVECYLREDEPDLTDYTPNQIDLAENSVLKFHEWEEENDFAIIDVEMKLVSEKYRYGGQCDIYCVLNSKKTLIDLKTSGGIYEEMIFQVAAYRQLLEENGYPVDECAILRIGRDETEGFEFRKINNTKTAWKIFENCLEIYQLKKEMKK